MRYSFYVFLTCLIILISKEFISAQSNLFDTIKINELIEKSNLLRKQNLDSALLLSNQSVILSESLKDETLKKIFIVKSLNVKGMIFVGKGFSDSALICFNKTLQINQSLNDAKAISRSYNNLGNVNYFNSNFKEALNFYLKSIVLSEKINDQKSIARTSDNIGNVYLKLDNPNKAIGFHKQALNQYKQINDSDGLASSYINIGLAYQKMGKSDSNLFYQQKALLIFEALQNFVFIGKCYNNIALAYDEMNNIDFALQYYEKALEISEKSGVKRSVGLALYNIGNLQLQKKEYEKAFLNFKKALNILEETESKELIKESYKKLAETANATGKYQEAYKYMLLFSDLKDSILNKETAQSIIDIQTKYDTEKKESQLKLKDAEIKKHEQKAFYQKIIFSSLVALILLIVAFVYIRIKQKQKIEKIKQETLLKEKEVETKEKERIRMAAELHDNVGASVSFISSKIDWMLHNQTLNEGNKEELNLLKNSAQEVIGSLRETIWTLNVKSISNIDFCDKLKVYIKKHVLCEVTITDNVIEEHIIPNEDVLALYRCCQEIINNINKHSKATKVYIVFESNNESKLHIVIEDNGVGFIDSNKEDSYGLRNIKARMEKIKSEIKISSELNKGTKIDIKY